MRWKPRDGYWIKGELSGEEAFSDGSAMFIGRCKGARVRKPINSFECALKKLLVKRLRRTKLDRMEKIGPLPYQLSCAVLRGETYIQEIYYQHALSFKGVELYLGKVTDCAGKAVICKVGKKIVGAIMPVRR